MISKATKAEKLALATLVDHACLMPNAGTKELYRAIQVANRFKVASICVKSCDVAQVKEHLKLYDCSLPICAVIGFPHGNTCTEIKIQETVMAIKQGAQEIDFVINIGRAIDGDDNYCKKEIGEIANVCSENNVLSKVIFENAYLSYKQKIQLCLMANGTKVDFVKTSTGFASLTPSGATIQDVELMREYVNQNIKVKASGGIKTIEQVIAFANAGADRIGLSGTEEIFEAYR